MRGYAGKMSQNIVQKTKAKYIEYEQRHQDILNAAIKLFNAKGYRGAKTLEIAKEAGISEPTMYKHFKSKKALFLACFQSIADELFGKYRGLYQEKKDDEIEYLKGIFDTYIDFVANSPDKSMFLVHMLSYWDDKDFKKVYRELMESSIESVSRVIESAKRKGLLESHVDSRFLAALFVGNYFLAIAVKDFIPIDQFTGDNFFEPIVLMTRKD